MKRARPDVLSEDTTQANEEVVDAGTAPMLPGLRLKTKYKRLGVVCKNPKQPEWWTPPVGVAQNNVVGITAYKRGGWRVELVNGKKMVCNSFVHACELRVNLTPPEPRRVISERAMSSITIPECPTLSFTAVLPKLVADLAPHMFVYEDCNGGKGTPLACKNQKVRGDIAEQVCRVMWVSANPIQNACCVAEETGDRANGSKRGSNQETHDFIAVKTDTGGAVRKRRIEVKLARMHFDQDLRYPHKDTRHWRLEFANVKKGKGVFDEVWLVFEGFDGLHRVVWDGETAYKTGGVLENTRGGSIQVSCPWGTVEPQTAHKQLLTILRTRCALKGSTYESALYTDEKYTSAFSQSTMHLDAYQKVPMARLSKSVRGVVHERVVRHVLEHCGYTTANPPASGTTNNGIARSSSNAEFDFCIGDMRGECKGGLIGHVISNGTPYWNWHVTGIKHNLHDMLVVVVHGVTGLHIWDYHEELLGGSIQISAGTFAADVFDAEQRILKKLAYSRKNVYLARIDFAEDDYCAFEAARPRVPFGQSGMNSSVIVNV